MIENVSEITSFDVEAIERKFRESRKITVPDSLRTKHGSIDKMRVVLQNWWNIPNIDTRYIDKKSLYQYRYFVQNFLKGDNKCPKCYQSLIEEYKDYITNQPEGEVKPMKESRKELVCIRELPNDRADTLRYIMKNWNEFRRIGVNDKRYTSFVRGLVRQVRDYKNGKMKKVSKIYLDILSGGKITKDSSKKVKEIKEMPSNEPQKLTAEVVVKRPEPSEGNLVNIIRQLKEIGVTEFTIKF